MKPLADLTILDLSRVLACPFASMILAELGATVIKVEQPDGGDETRHYEPFVAANGAAVSAYYMACNRSKQSLTLNLRHPEGQRIARELAARSDVFVENFPVGKLAEYGLDYGALRATNSKLVYLSCTGFGQTGPYAHRKGYDTIFQAMGGLMSLTGDAGGAPVKAGLPIADLTSGLWAAIAILAALRGRERTNQGCHIDLSMLDGQVSLLTLAAARYFALGEVPPRLGTEHPGRVPSASFRCADDTWLHITCGDQHWLPFCRVLGLDEWGSRAACATNTARVAHRVEIMPRLREVIATWTRTDLLHALEAADVPAGPLNTLDQILADEHVAARRVVDGFDDPTIGHFPALRLPYRFEGLDDPDVGRPPALGEHTDQLLAERLGLSAERITALRKDHVI